MDEFWAGLIVFMVYVPLMFIWAFALIDLFTRGLSGLAKAGWAFGIVFFPIFGMLLYFITRPRVATTMPNTDVGYAAALSEQKSTALRDLETLSRMHDEGSLTDDEYARLKGGLIPSGA